MNTNKTSSKTDTSQESLPAPPDIISQTAYERFGIPGLFPFQRLVISNILEGCSFFGEHIQKESFRNQIVILPTGSGKSLCFSLPGVLLDSITLIIFPLLSLISDQARRLQEAGISNSKLVGGQSKEERAVLWKKLAAGEISFLLTNPESLQQKSVLKKLSQLTIGHAVIDEAHIVSEWGTTFRPSYLEIGKVLNKLNIGQITAFTATAARTTIDHIKTHVFCGNPVHLIQGNPDRPNITYRIIPSLSKMQDLSILTNQESGMVRPIIIFCGTRKTAVHTAINLRLRLQDNQIFYYHAGLSKDERKEIEDWFYSSDDGILCATSAYGMGIDKPNIRSVIHIALSSSVGAYLQETGRAGRDQQPAKTAMLFGVDEWKKLHRTGGKTDQECRESALLSIFIDYSKCRRESLLAALSAEPEACFGCDICSGTLQYHATGEREILKLIRRYPLKLTIHEASLILRGRYSLDVKQRRLYQYRGFGTLSGWILDDIEDAIHVLKRMSHLKSARKGPWKDLLRVTGCITSLNRPPADGFTQEFSNKLNQLFSIKKS
ncbi:MAG: ATP-dependent DNA helicase RecQ [Bacteroidetes bacterium]|nr:ATP-dependent DNA helicase RecQ [Bacteroidota bacterium]